MRSAMPPSGESSPRSNLKSRLSPIKRLEAKKETTQGKRETAPRSKPRSRFRPQPQAGLIASLRDERLLTDLFLQRVMSRSQLQVLHCSAEPSLLAQPCEGTLDDPAVRLHRKALLPFGGPHDLQCPAARGSRPSHKFAAIGGVRPHPFEAWERAHAVAKYFFGSVSVLHVACLNRDSQQKPLRIYEQVPPSAFDLLVGVVAEGAFWPPLSPALTLWLSRIAAEGLASRPFCWRIRSRKSR